MGASRRLFVRSDEEDEGSGDLHGDGAGPSTSSALRKSKRLSAWQVAPESHNTAGKSRKLKRLKRTLEKAAKDSDSDWEEESSECEEIPETAWRQKWSQKKGDKEVRGDGSKRNSKESPVSPVCAKKRKQKLSSAQRTSHSKAKFGWYDARFNGSTQKQNSDDDALIFLGEDFEHLLFEDAVNASRETYTKEIDLPERFQMHEQDLTATASMNDWTKEAHWIHNRLFGDFTTIKEDEELKCITDIDKEEIIKEIVAVLMQLHVEKCEVPVIGMYNFHKCPRLARRIDTKEVGFGCAGNSLQIKSFKALWMIFQWDRKWLSLLRRKSTQQDTWKNRAMTKVIGSDEEDRTLDVVMQALQEADSEVTVDDLDAKFNLQFPVDEKAPPKGQYKRPRRQSLYGLCCKSGLRHLVRQLGLTPEQLGENLHGLQKIHEPLDLTVPPEEVDLSYASGQFTEPQKALEGARHMAAYELSCEPRVRKFVRSLFDQHAVVSTAPTSKGEVLIDAFHELACVKNVKAKSVKSFNGGEWLLIQKAEEDELVEVRIELTQEVFDEVLIQSLHKNYFSNASNEVSELWNEQRKLILQEALAQMLLPLLAKDMRLSLTVTAKAWIQAECCKSLWKRVTMAPYPISDPFVDASTSSKDNTSKNAIVMVCCWGSRDPPTTFVILDAFGELVDSLQTGYLNVRPGSHEQQLQRKVDDQERLKKFILMHKPNVVVVGAVINFACRHLKDTIAETVGKAAEVNSALISVPVIYGDESLASLYEKSQVSLVQLPKQPSIIRRAVALGRSLQNPLAVIAALCNPSKDIVALSMHPMQRFLSAEDLYASIECVMVTVTNQIGVDVNLAVAHEWLFSPLQFVCGLGWKKASKIQQLIQESGWLPSRESLLRYPFSLKDVVFRNCSAFLRIRRVGHAVSGLRKLDPLDDTRIHPEYYEFARNLAIYALTNGQASLDSEKDMDVVEAAIAHFRKNPDAFTEEIVMNFFNSLQLDEVVNIDILKDVRKELLDGFSDFRAPYSQPTQDEEFTWLTGEDEASLCIGKAVNVIVQKVFRHRAICTLESRLRGVLEKEDFTSDSNVDLTQVLSEGSTLTCYVANVFKDQFSVQLSCLGNNMEAHDSDVSVPHAERVLCSEEAVLNKGQPNAKDLCFKPRDIHHPLFQNVSMSDAIKALSEENPNKVMFHPSSEGPACLSMTLKCQDNVYIQKEIEEFEKDSSDLSTFSRLGNTLKIDGRNFSTLDEVVTSYASPLVSKMNDVLQSREFQSGNDDEIRSFLNQEKEVSTDGLVYCFSLCPNNLGAIALSYMVGEKVFTEKVDLYPEGYGLQNKMFRKMDTVINYIKKTVSDARCRLVGPEEERHNRRGDGTERGRGGRFGSGRRGRGFRGRGGRGNSFSGKWGAQETENSDWNSAGAHRNEHKKHEEQDFNNSWAAEESNGWNEQKPGFEASKSQDEKGWGVADGSPEKFESGWGADDSEKAEKQDISGWHIGEKNDATGGNGWNAKGDSVEASEGQNDSGWGNSDIQSDKGQTGLGGWGATDSKINSTEKGSWGAVDCTWASQDTESHKERGNGTERGRGGRFGCGQRGRGFQGRGGRGNSSSEKREAQETENSDWNSAGSHMRNESGWGADDSGNTVTTGWGVAGSGMNNKQDLNGWHVGEENGGDKNGAGTEASKGQNDRGWGDADVQLDKGETGFGWGASDSKNTGKGGWGASDSKNTGKGGWGASDSKNTGKGGWGAAGFVGAGQEDSYKQSGDGRGRGRGFGFGSGRRGRGFGGRAGRGNSFAGKWGSQEKESSGWNSDRKQEEQGFSNDWAARQSTSWNDQQVDFKVSRNQGESGQGLTDGSSEKFEREWGADDSKNNEKEEISSWHTVEEKSATIGGNAKGDRVEASKGRNGSGWGDADVQLDKGETEFGWGANDSKNTENSGWGTAGCMGAGKGDKVEASKSQNDSGWGDADVELDKGGTEFGWGTNDPKNTERGGWGGAGCIWAGKGDRVEVSKGQNHSGWGDAYVPSGKRDTEAGWGANDSKNTEKGGWGAAGCTWAGQDEGSHKQRGDDRGRGRGRRFGSGRRGRGFGGRDGRGNNFSGKWGQQEAGSSDWNSADPGSSEFKNHKEQGFNNRPVFVSGSNSWNENKGGFELSRTQDKSGWGIPDGSSEKFESGWGAGDSKSAEKQERTGWHVGEENGATEGSGWNAKGSRIEASKGQNDRGWGDADVQLGRGETGKAWGAGDSKNTEKGGWGAAGFMGAGQDDESYKQSGDARGRGRGGRFGSWRRGQGFGGRAGRGNSFSGKWGAQERESNDWNSADSCRNEHRKHEEQGFMNNWAVGESTGWSEQKAGFKESRNEGESEWGVAHGSSEKFESGWGADDSTNAEKQEMSGWHVGEGNSASKRNGGNGKGDRVEASKGQNDSCWGDTTEQLDKGQSARGWGDDGSKSTEKQGWGDHTCAGQGEEREQKREDGTDLVPGESFEAGQGGQSSEGEGKSSAGKWTAEETDKRDKNSAGSLVNEHKNHNEQGFDNWNAEESHGLNEQKASFAVVKNKESNKESPETAVDGIWGACEDLIDSNELEGLSH
ncbi:hypothetical protein GOP47_0012535 [Adiantum capillus-veneris]|uniref:YqgF/RNase H-like domain-containing protein n=1 Tax=Adiantum capillus-veneris TaxID=13818 RepID=A0A9D4ZEI3_ADICA|nr:hypothetical protein GOP47_0012535 [Adiantum capillus-veneris]